MLDPTPALYEQAFSLLAMAALERLSPGRTAADALALRTALEGSRHAAGGWREVGEQPFQANAHMHLLEAALAWEAAAAGLCGVEAASGVALGALWSDLTVREPATRLWVQAEYLKATLIFGDPAEALRAAEGLALYLDTPRRGTWRDKRRADGSFVDEPAPATSFYHLVRAILPLRERR